MLGIFGGTFDPIHYGHLRPALEVKQALELDLLYFIPLAMPVHRSQPRVNSGQRLAMIRAAVVNQPGFAVDDREIRRSGPSYTVDTLLKLRLEYPYATLCLLIGHDAFQQFLSWRNPLQILQLAHLVVMQRPDCGCISDPLLINLLNERCCQDSGQLHNCQSGRIFLQPVTQLSISSSVIRAKLAAGEDVRFLLPDPVLEIIRNAGLYS